MKEIYKKIGVRNGKITYEKLKDHIVGTYINYGVLDENGYVDKILSFNMDNDFSFSATIYNKEEIKKIEEIKEIDFIIDKENQMYEPLKNFLGENKEFLLDDDNSAEINKKTMRILDEEENIKITFENLKCKKESPNEKFKIFIKNILMDGRSKLDKKIGDNTKERLFNLFQDLDVALCPKETLENFIMPKFEYCINNLDYHKKTIFKIIPELEIADGFDQKHPQHLYDVWGHTIKAIEKSKPDLQIRLALLLHDIGKPHSCQEENGVRHFPGHPEKSAKMAKQILTRLGYDEKEIQDVCYLVEHHDDIIDVNQVNSNNRELIEKLLYIQYCDAYAHHPNHIEKRIRKLNEIKLQIEEKFEVKEDTDKGER